MTNEPTIDQRIDVATAKVRLELPAEPVSISIGRSVIRRIVTFSDDDAESSFLIAFTEIITNAIEEHQRAANDDRIVVDIAQGAGAEGGDQVCVRDFGEGFEVSPMNTEPTPILDPRPQDMPVSDRGRGLALAGAFVDDISIESSPSGTSVVLPLAGFGIIR